MNIAFLNYNEYFFSKDEYFFSTSLLVCPHDILIFQFIHK